MGCRNWWPIIAWEEYSSGSLNSCVIAESLAAKCFMCDKASTISGMPALCPSEARNVGNL